MVASLAHLELGSVNEIQLLWKLTVFKSPSLLKDAPISTSFAIQRAEQRTVWCDIFLVSIFNQNIRQIAEEMPPARCVVWWWTWRLAKIHPGSLTQALKKKPSQKESHIFKPSFFMGELLTIRGCRRGVWVTLFDHSINCTKFTGGALHTPMLQMRVIPKSKYSSKTGYLPSKIIETCSIP